MSTGLYVQWGVKVEEGGKLRHTEPEVLAIVMYRLVGLSGYEEDRCLSRRARFVAMGPQKG